MYLFPKHAQRYEKYLKLYTKFHFFSFFCLYFVLIAQPDWNDVYMSRIELNFAKTNRISTEMVIYLVFMRTFAMPLMNLLVFKCSTRVSGNSDMAK